MRLAVLTLVLSALVPTDAADLTLYLRHVGPIHYGMTVAEANRASGLNLQISPDEDQRRGCTHVYPGGSFNAPVAFMVWDDEIMRASVHRPGIRTMSGIGVGATEDEVRSAYPGRLTESPHPYVDDGHYLTFTPRDPADRDYLLIFETWEDTVRSFRSGFDGAVILIEGCS